ncbi:MAG: hypothetical protein Fur0021_12330 [Candidatus Promineifilaceae bacterium]
MLTITMYAYFVALVLFIIGWFITRDISSNTTRAFIRGGLVALYVMPAITLAPGDHVVLPALLAMLVDLLDTGFIYAHPFWIAFWWLFTFSYAVRRTGQRKDQLPRRR